MDAARAEIVGVQTCAASTFVEHHQLFALLETPNNRRERANIDRVGVDVEHVAQDSPDFAEKHADELAPDRHRKAQEPLDGEAERVLLVHRRDIVEPVEIGDRLQIGLIFDQLLGAAMEQADMRIDPLDELAVEFENHAQNAVGGRMLRPKIDCEVPVLRRPLAPIKNLTARFHTTISHGSPLPRKRNLSFS